MPSWYDLRGSLRERRFGCDEVPYYSQDNEQSLVVVDLNAQLCDNDLV
jgi:hypothetical protein